MNFIHMIRSWLGIGRAELIDEPTQIEQIESYIQKSEFLQSLMQEKQKEFEDLSESLELKILACDKIIHKGETEVGALNKKYLSDRLEKATDIYLEESHDLIQEIKEHEANKLQFESEVISKCIEIVACATDADRENIKEELGRWELTGLIKGERCDHQILATAIVVDALVKSESIELGVDEEREEFEKGLFEGLRGGKVIGHTKTGKAIYEKHSHSAHKKFNHSEHMDAAQLHDKHAEHAMKSNDPSAMMDHTQHGVGHREAAAKAFYNENYASDEHKEKLGLRKAEDVGELEKAKTDAPFDGSGHYVNMLIKLNGKILFLQRADNKVIAPGQFCLPGGHIDEGETLGQAAIRELKEEANIVCKGIYPIAKAKCDNGKWAFYFSPIDNIDISTLAILDGESKNAVWMDESEWMVADLFFDLKDHLIAMEQPDPKHIRTISKGETDEEDFEKAFVGGFGKKESEGSRGGRVIGRTKSGKPVYARLSAGHYKGFGPKDHNDAAGLHRGVAEKSPGEGHDYGNTESTSRYWHNKKAQEHDHEADKEVKKAEEPEFEKGGKKDNEGEVRKWGSKEYKKVGKKWHEIIGDKKKPLAVADVVAHAENTSTPTLKKVATDKGHHLSDAAAREIERRKAEKDKKETPKLVPSAIVAPKEEEKPKKVKKPDVVKYSPNSALSHEHSKIEKDFGKHLNKNFDRLVDKYKKQFGNVLNTDNARELSEQYQKNKSELSAAVHEPSSSFIKKLYADMLTEKPEKGQRNLVYFTAGGTGAGKTSGLQGAEKSHYNKAQIVFDTNMNSMSGSVQKIEQALEAGKKVRINYTFRDPIDSFINGAVPRSLRIGRTVPIESHVETHMGSMSVVQGLKEKYRGNKNVHIIVTDNSRGKGNTKQSTVDFVKQQEKKYNASDLRTQLHEHNNKLYEEGKISESHHRGFRG